MTGTHLLKSGNKLHWEHLTAGARGGFRAEFERDPTPADLAEGKAFCEANVPATGTIAKKVLVNNTQAARAGMYQFLYGGNRN